jgi:hypothetical protein
VGDSKLWSTDFVSFKPARRLAVFSLGLSGFGTALASWLEFRPRSLGTFVYSGDFRFEVFHAVRFQNRYFQEYGMFGLKDQSDLKSGNPCYLVVSAVAVF